MDWSNEHWIKVYTRDTVDFANLSMEAQAVLVLLLRKVNRMGEAHLGKSGKAGVATLLGHKARRDFVEPAVEELLADGCITIENGTLTVPNFAQAQTARTSDRLRKQMQRDREIVAASQGVTAVPTESPEVTEFPIRSDQIRSSNCTETVTETETLHLTAVVPIATTKSSPAKKARSAREVNPRHAPLRERLMAAFAQARGGAEHPWSGREAKSLDTLLGWSKDDDDILRRFTAGLSATAWGQRIESINDLARTERWNALAAGGARKVTQAPSPAAAFGKGGKVEF